MLCPFSFTPHMASVIVDVIILLFINVVGPQIYEHHMQMCNEKLGSLFFSVADLIMVTVHSSVWLASVNVLHNSSPFPGWPSACGGVTVPDCLCNTGSEVCTVFSELVLVSAGSGWSGLLCGLVTFAMQLFVSLVFCWCLQLLMEAAVILALFFWLFSDDFGPHFNSHWLCGTLWSLWILGHASNHHTSMSEVVLS